MRKVYCKWLLVFLCILYFEVQAYTISGVVRHQYLNTSLAGVRIALGTKSMPYTQYWAMSGADGGYAILNVPAGEYYVFTEGMTGAGTAIDDYKRLYNILYYPNSADRAGAEYISLVGNRQNIDLTLTGRYIKGILKNASTGQPMVGQWVRLFSTDWQEVDACQSNTYGVFYFGRLEPASFNMGVIDDPYLQYYRSSPNKTGAALLELANTVGLQNIEFNLRENVPLSGRITDALGMPIGRALVCLLYEPAWEWWDYAIPGYSAISDSNGEYEITAVDSGKCYLIATGQIVVGERPEDQLQIYAPAYYDSTGNPKNASPIDSLSSLNGYNFVLDTAIVIWGHLIKKQGGDPVAMARISISRPADGFTLEAFTDENGAFNFDRLSAGEYTLFASGAVQSGSGEVQSYNPLSLDIHTGQDAGGLVLQMQEIELGIAAHASAPGSSHLAQNFPNPFNHSTVISYKIAQAGHVQLKIYNIAGQLVQMHVNKLQNAGEYAVSISMTDAPAGIYFYQLESGLYKSKIYKCAYLK